MLRIALPIALALALVANRTSAQSCRADFDSSGAVEVNEVILVVNEALGACAGQAATPTRGQRTATPTRTPTSPPADACPYRFNQAVSPDRFCNYFGSGDGPCSDPFLSGGGWITDGQAVIAILVDEFGDSVAIDARRTNPTTARVTSVALGPDFENPVSATGTLALPSTSRFTISFDIGTSCGRLSFDGDFDGLIGENAVRVESLAGLRRSLEQRAPKAPEAKPDQALARMTLRKFARRALPNFRRRQ